jgi:hypothetical protein
MNADFNRGRGWPDLLLVAHRELAVRVRGTAFRVSTILLLAVTVAGIAIAAALTGHPQRFTVAATAQSPPTLTAMVRADAKAAGLQVTTATATDRTDAVRLVEQGNAAAAVAAGPEIIWKGNPNSTCSRYWPQPSSRPSSPSGRPAWACPPAPPPGYWHRSR